MKEILIKLIRRQPFAAFTIHLSNGSSFEIRHPEMAALLKSNLIIGKPESDDFEICPLLHIANVTTNGSGVVE